MLLGGLFCKKIYTLVLSLEFEITYRTLGNWPEDLIKNRAYFFQVWNPVFVHSCFPKIHIHPKIKFFQSYEYKSNKRNKQLCSHNFVHIENSQIPISKFHINFDFQLNIF